VGVVATDAVLTKDAKREVKTTDWTRLGWESLQYALAHVAPDRPFLERSRALFALALKQKRHARDVTRIRGERGASSARRRPRYGSVPPADSTRSLPGTRRF